MTTPKRTPGLMNRIYLGQMESWVHVCCIPGEEMSAGCIMGRRWCSGQPWVLAFVWMLLWHVPPSLRLLQTTYT